MKTLLSARTLLARDGFMSRCLEPSGAGLRPPLVLELLPEPRVERSQWDHGDCTSRALRAWHVVRCILGRTADSDRIEAGLWRHLRSCIDPRTGLVVVPEFSDLPDGPAYVHTWDQGRLFDALVLRWSDAGLGETERAEALPLIRALQRGLINLSRTSVAADGAVARWWPGEVFLGGSAQTGPHRLGPHDFRDWVIASSQLLQPQTALARLTGDPADLALALELARGFLGGYESRRGSTAPMFAADGSFRGHFHGAVSGLDGLVQLATLLWERGDRRLGGEWIDLAVRAYRWIHAGGGNANPASCCGWYPETARAEPHHTSELCCTADMLELAAHLAACAGLDPRWSNLCDLWDDVERAVRGEVALTQVTAPERLIPLLRLPAGSSRSQAIACLERQRGSWIFGRPHLHDLAGRLSGAQLVTGDAPGGAPAAVRLGGAGCCAYSGLRALHVAWLGAVAQAGATTEVRIPTSHHDGRLAIVALADDAGLEITAHAAGTVRVRIPATVSAATVGHPGARWDDDRRWVELALPAGGTATLSWTPRAWERTETTGIRALATGRQLACHSTWRGNRLLSMGPDGAVLPFAAGL
jgi:hypothetical protein